MSLLKFIQRNTQPSLFQSYQNYLNQALPDISGIFASTPAQAVEETTEETVAQPVGLTREQLLLLYPELRNQSSGGNDNDDSYDDYLNRIDNNAGIYSFKDLRNVFSATPMAAKIGGLLGGPFGFAAGLIGTNVADRLGFTQAGRDRKAREEAAARGAAKQAAIRERDLQSMRGPIGRDGDGGGDSGPSGPPSGPGESSSDAGFGGGGTFGSSVNDADSFSDYS
jgi:hypothetical protein